MKNIRIFSLVIAIIFMVVSIAADIAFYFTHKPDDILAVPGMSSRMRSPPPTATESYRKKASPCKHGSRPKNLMKNRSLLKIWSSSALAQLIIMAIFLMRRSIKKTVHLFGAWRKPQTTSMPWILRQAAGNG